MHLKRTRESGQTCSRGIKQGPFIMRVNSPARDMLPGKQCFQHLGVSKFHELRVWTISSNFSVGHTVIRGGTKTPEDC